jgi:hypothetical protein
MFSRTCMTVCMCFYLLVSQPLLAYSTVAIFDCSLAKKITLQCYSFPDTLTLRWIYLMPDKLLLAINCGWDTMVTSHTHTCMNMYTATIIMHTSSHMLL